ncbi:MAG: DUF2490 domain-containing protein [Saprospiraceae bacterium]|nr:DUF2490 domain-containing protein [Lewinella sp.]MCB0664431.1 DUF2490 domain-containing protein [Saprospiraceae bacterium]
MKIQSILWVVLVVTPVVNYAQGSNQFGLLPSFNLNLKLPRDWALNFKAESRQSIRKRDDFKYEYLFTDLSLAGGKKIGVNTRLVIGYLVRLENEGTQNRTIQQLNIVKRYVKVNLAHRIAADQTFADDEAVEWRFRYRLSAEIPLSGQSLDVHEFFIKANNEYLNSLQGEKYDLEIRSVGFIGYVTSPVSKLELGLDYRIDSFINGRARNRFWLALNVYQSIQ